MHRRPSPRVRPGLLAAVLLLASLAGCGGLTPEDARVCEGFTCSAGYCLAEGGQPVCHCGALEQALGQTCTLSRVDAPPVVTDDTPAGATVLEPSAEARTFIFDRLDVGKVDVDYYAFQAEAGHIYRVTCLGISCGVNVLGEAQQMLTWGTDAFVELSAAGRYYLRAVSGSSYGGAYTLRLMDLGLDDVGDTDATATPRAPSAEPFSGLLETPTDVDVFALQATAGRIYRWRCTVPEGSGWGLQLGPSGGALGASLVNGQGQAQLSLQATSTGPLRAAILAGNGYSTPPFMHYTCTLEDVGVDDHGSTPAEATPLTLGTPVGVRVQWGGDEDLLAFAGPTPAGHLYRVTVSPVPPDVSSVHFEDGVISGLPRALEKTAQSVVYTVKTRAARPLYIRVSGEPADYTVQLDDGGPEDHGDTHATATALAVGQTAQGSLEVGGDEDDFALSLAAGQRYVLETSSTAVHFIVFGADGTYVPFESGGPPYAFTPKTAGTYFVQATEAGYTSLGPAIPYSFTVR